MEMMGNNFVALSGFFYNGTSASAWPKIINLTVLQGRALVEELAYDRTHNHVDISPQSGQSLVGKICRNKTAQIAGLWLFNLIVSHYPFPG